MTITTENFEASHGHKPKPSQHGLWMFLIERRPGECCKFQATGLYRDALRGAKTEAKLIGGASCIIVCP